MAKIVKQEHNLDNIDYGGDQAIKQANPNGRRPSAPWDTMEYGMTLAEAQRRYDAAQTPEAKEGVVRQLKAMAQQRAQLDNTTGKVAVMTAGKLPWHGLGVNVAEAVGSVEALQLASLDWEVQKQRLTYLFGGKSIQSDSYALVRSDTGAQLGQCKEVYQPIQNKDAFGFMDEVLSQFGARYETAGSIYGGEQVWMLALMPQQSFEAPRGDQVDAYALFQLDHTGAGATFVFPTSVRTVCANTYRMAQRDRSKGIRLTHKGNIRDKVAEAQRALGLAVTAMAAFREASQELVRREVNPVTYFNQLLDQLCDFPQGETVDSMLAKLTDISPLGMEVARDLLTKRKAKRDDTYRALFTAYESARCSPKGTAWAAFNAVTDWADHSGKQKSQSAKFEACLSGAADEAKQAAFTLAMAC